MGTQTTGTVRRLTTAATATGCMLCLGAGAALADHTPYPPEEVQVVVTTPSAIVEIYGTNWEPATEVEIRPRAQQGREATAAEAQPVRVTVAEDGTFEAPVQVPDDAVEGTLEYEVVGTASDGTPRQEVETFTVQAAASPLVSGTPFEPAAEDDTAAGWLVAGAAAAVAGGGLVLRRRRRAEV